MAKESVIPQEALDYLKRKGLKPGFDYRDVWQSEHNNSFTVAKMMQLDMLEDTKKIVEQALEQGWTYQQFRDNLKPMLVKRGWWGVQTMDDPLTGETKMVQLGSDNRLKTIYRTNMRTARAAGQWERIERSKETHPYLLYELGPSREHRLEHVQWNGLLLPVDDDFWHTHYPANGWGCKCRVRQVSQREADKLQKTGINAGIQEINAKTGLPTGHFTDDHIDVKTHAPKVELREWTNKRTGEVEQVPKGIDPGWAYNAGIVRAPDRARAINHHKALTGDVTVTESAGVVKSAFSTLDNVTAKDLSATIAAIPDTTERLNKLEAFVSKYDIKTVVIQQAQMGSKNKAAKSILADVQNYLANPSLDRYGHNVYALKKPAKVAGFTSPVLNHVNIKGSVTHRFDDVSAIATRLKSSVGKSFTQQYYGVEDGIKTDDPAYLVVTWLHEVGHQFYFKTGELKPPLRLGRKLSKYASETVMEEFAESFAAYMIDRKGLKAFHPEMVSFIDNLLDEVIK